jgi:exosortase D (VPLPA-CTERM-specific)
VGCLQVVGVTAFREGNVIDLGPVQLQVVEACSGIRYLFPLAALTLLCAYLFRDRLWKRVVLVLSALPISVLVNGFRIGIVGILVELYGPQAAEGFFHLFEGWVLFMASLSLMVGEMWLLSRVHPLGGSRSFLDRFTWRERHDYARTSPEISPPIARPLTSRASFCSVAVLVPFAMLSSMIGDRTEIPPSRPAFMDFSMHIGTWRGTPLTMEPQYIAALKFDDYLLADYAQANENPVSLYVAYYRSQKKGQSAHSPQSCIPGGGWEILSHRPMDLASGTEPKAMHRVNRVFIQKDHEKQLVLYWFKQRHRLLTNEYLVKLYLAWDALTRDRTDGALIRLATVVEPGETEAGAERRLVALALQVEPELTRYIPD